MTPPSVKAELSHKNATVSNGNINPFIPLDVIEQIFHRADTKTLIRCSSVCRDWNALITSPDFMFRNLNQTFDSKKQMILLKARQNRESGTNVMEYDRFLHCPSTITYSLHWDEDQFNLFRIMESPPISNFGGTHVIDVSNGLVCLIKELPFEIILWNLTIRKYVCLPLPMTWNDYCSHVGFGFDRINNDFKVVNLVTNEFMHPTQFQSTWIFSYVTGSWKCLTCNLPPQWFIYCGQTCVSLNGVLHWIAWCKEDAHKPRYFILTFDLTLEVFGQIFFPSGARHDCVNHIVTAEDSLLLIQETHVNDDGVNEDGVVSNFFSVWIMKQFGSHVSWKNIFSTTSEIDPELILGARKNGEIMLDMGGGEICRYNLTTPTIVPAETMKNGVFFCYFTKSLYLLERGKGISSY